MTISRCSLLSPDSSNFNSEVADDLRLFWLVSVCLSAPAVERKVPLPEPSKINVQLGYLMSKPRNMKLLNLLVQRLL